MLGHGAISELPLSTVRGAQAALTTTTTLRFASKTFTTRATDVPAHATIRGRIKDIAALGRRISSADDGQFGSLIETRFGDIELNNADGGLDYITRQYATDGRRIVLKIGATEIDSLGREKVQSFANFATVYTSVAGPLSAEQDIIRLRIESLSNRLQGRMQSSTYAGTGGQQGTADMAGRTLPLAFGRCLNVSAQLVDPALLTYQLNSGTMDSITEIYDAGVSVPFDADYASYAALEAASVLPGSYASSLGAGFIRLGSIPTGQITADVRGSNADDGFTTYSDQCAPIIRKALVLHGGLVSAELDTASFTTFDALQPESIGIFLPSGDQTTIEDFIGQVAFACGAVVGQDQSGLYRILRLDPPAANAHWDLTDRNIHRIDREPLPYRIPWETWGVGYQRNWTVQRDADLATSVTQARRQFLQSELRYVYAQNSAIALNHLSSSLAPLRESLFLNQAVAQAEADRLIDLYGAGRAFYRIITTVLLFSAEIGQTVRVTSYKHDLSAGKNFLITGIEDSAGSRETSLLVFG